MQWITQSLRGKEKLWKVFWIYGLLLPIPVCIVVGVTLGGMHIHPKDHIVGISFLLTIYAVWLNLSLWKCAFNADIQFWGYIVRFFVVLYFIHLPFDIASMSTEMKKPFDEAVPGYMQSCAEVVAYYAQLNKVDLQQYKQDHPDAEHQMAELGKCVEAPGAKGTRP